MSPDKTSSDRAFSSRRARYRLNATAAHSAQKESLTTTSADSSQTQPDKTQPNKEPQLSAISIAPIPPAVINAAAVKLSASPEHSEHHTGYAIDIGDGDRPDTDLAPQFADTAAYQWLLNNAYIFGFEQSFPQNNAQGLNFEPWHWRYVQSERAMQVFAAAKATQTPQP
ncbi:MAG: hypothetical protein DCF25_20395 [Leptolyngbya foveolarum]|uniref:D-alanyl-D-alanine carboxypeptidase-like core domain-containing protein n=1 Tax=Leptolyngbya foveolarum TaxID=47253 RepID=A0A2W4U084_9CYAN|nr:MAG: hypothetical protein DCF25_20395 [Leptolyngbya foveolarum]